MYILYQISYSYITFVPENKGFENNGIILPISFHFQYFEQQKFKEKCILGLYCMVLYHSEIFYLFKIYISDIHFILFLNEGKE